MPDTKDDLIRHYTFSESDLSIIRQRRGPANRLGFAVQPCYLRFPGVILGVDEPPFPPLLRRLANQLKVGVESWDEYGQREQTRREHLVELQTVFGFQPFAMGHYRQAVQLLTELALQTDKGIVLASALNKGEARNALARAVFFNRLGEIRDRSFEQQRYRASGLNLVTAAIVLWNT
ncbi:Tn3 family transposase, partial [Verminephrobacter eiseniae]|nr:Tn3 family transposase [Verminephrobacter eiseniae]